MQAPSSKRKSRLALRFLCEIENDVNCAGLAEAVSGSGKGASVTLCLTIGTGIGGCLIMDGKVFHGFSNSACEVGYMHMQDGAFQDLASTTALVKYVAEAHGEDVDQWNGRRIFKEATEGNKICMAGIDRMVDYLGKGLANICYVANPEVVILGGGIMGQEAILKPKIRTALKEALVPSLAEKTRLEFAHHQNTAGMLGAYYHFILKKIKEQTRKLSVGCSKHCFEVVDKTDEVSNHISTARRI